MMNSADDEPREADGRRVSELHGVTLERLLIYLHATYGWPYLAEQLRINCFVVDPNIKSSLVFLRRTPWARQKVETLYINTRLEELRQLHKAASGG